MLEHHLASLTKRQSMLLLTAVTFGGQESLGALEFLPEAEAVILQHRARKLLELPRERRIPMLVQEIKRLVTPRRGQLWATGPDQLAQLMLRERPVLRQVLLRALPSGLADSVRRHLPPERTTPKREARPEILNIVRSRLEEILARATPVGASFKFADVLLLQPREMVSLLDGLGTRALAPALAGLPENLRREFLDDLPPGPREVVAEAAAAADTRRLLEDDAQEMLANHGGEHSFDILLSAGAQRLSRALLAQSTEFAARVLERNAGPIGTHLNRWLKAERTRAVNRGDGGRAEAVSELERLAIRGLVERPLRPVNPVAIASPPPGSAGSAGSAGPASAPPAAEKSARPADPRLRPPLLPAPRAQAALRMAAVGLKADRPDVRRPAPPGEHARMRPPPAPRAPDEAPARPRQEPSRPPPGSKPGGRGPKGGSG